MKNTIEWLFYLGGSILIWCKLGVTILTIGVLIYFCYKVVQALKQINSLRSV